MAHPGSSSPQPIEVASPPEPASRARRSAYLVLAVSGVVLATAFGGIAQLASRSTSSDGADSHGGSNNPGSQQVLPGGTVDEPASETVPASTSSSPTALVSVGTDGKRTVTLLPPPGSSQTAVTLPPGSPIPPGVVTTTASRFQPPPPPPTSKPQESSSEPPTTPPTSDPPPSTTTSSSASSAGA